MRFHAVLLGLLCFSTACLTTPEIAPADSDVDDVGIDTVDWLTVFDPWTFEEDTDEIRFLSVNDRRAFSFMPAGVTRTTELARVGTTALSLEAGSHMALEPQRDLLPINGDFIVGGWFRPTSSMASEFFVFGDPENDVVRTIRRNNDGLVECYQNDDNENDKARSSERVSNESWAHIACRFSPDKIEVFLNGKRKATDANFETQLPSGPTIFGSRSPENTPNRYSGQIDDVFFFEHSALPPNTDLEKRMNWVYACGLSGEDCSCENGKTTADGQNAEDLPPCGVGN